MMVETRRYKITATKEQLDILEALFETMEYMGKIGASRDFKLYVGGDGVFHPKFEKYENGEFSKVESGIIDYNENAIHHGDGVIKKTCEEFNGDKFFIYYDFG